MIKKKRKKQTNKQKKHIIILKTGYKVSDGSTSTMRNQWPLGIPEKVTKLNGLPGVLGQLFSSGLKATLST